MDDDYIAHKHEGILFSCEESEITKFAGQWMDLEIVTPCEGNPDPERHMQQVHSQVWSPALNLLDMCA